jgi:antitoxin YefM
METIFRLKASEIDSRFLTTLKTLFKKREIEITVTDIVEDETEFLSRDPKNKAHLLKAIEEVKQNKNLVRFSGEEFKKYSKSLLKK